MDIQEAKRKLNRVIQLSRVEMYKPIQVAETLRRMISDKSLKPLEVESYRNLSREWRNEVTRRLFGKVSTSSMRYQDDIWNQSALPPEALKLLDIENRNGSVVEEYIYQNVYKKSKALIEFRKQIDSVSDFADFIELYQLFDTPDFINSRDRLFEITTLSVLQDGLNRSNYEMQITGDSKTLSTIGANKLLEISHSGNRKLTLGKMGHANAADAGLDIWTNFGVVISVKNYHVDSSLLNQIELDTPVGDLLVVCKSHESFQLGSFSRNSRHISFLTEKDLLIDARETLDDDGRRKGFLEQFKYSFDLEFPLALSLESFMHERGYRITFPKSDSW